MSSAILYLAIVAIWACVLIPRWLRRDSARVSGPVQPPAAAEPAAAELAAAEPEAGTENAPAPADADPDVAEPVPARLRVAEPLSAEESRRRILAARRRLLLMLIGLEIAAVALAVLRLAAVWVVVPPSIMLIGYLLLLREAGKADAERAKHEAEAAARARERARHRTAQSGRVTPVEGTPIAGVAEAAALAGKLAAAPVPADYEDAGRDFAPGLAGKYTTSNADAGSADEDHYDPTRLRAVGD